MRPAFVLFLLLLSGCFRMGMPEYVAPVTPATDSRAPVAVVVRAKPATPLADTPSYETLGYQFVLGFIPVTRLYLEHGVESAVEEATLAVLQEKGFATFVVDRRSLPRVVATIRPRLTITTQVSEVSLHAYDALFLRIISLSGLLSVSRISPDGTPVGAHSFPIKERRFRMQAPAPLLASVLESSIRDGMRELLSNQRVARKSRKPSVAPINQFPPLVFVQSPFSRYPMPKEVGAQIAESYGFRTVPAFSQLAVLRMVHRGLAEGFDAKQVVVAPPNVAQFLERRGGHWALGSQVERLMLHYDDNPKGAGIELSMQFSLSEGFTSLLEARCQVFQPLAQGHDGYWVVTLEQAATAALEAFINYRTTGSVADNTTDSSTVAASCSG